MPRGGTCTEKIKCMTGHLCEEKCAESTHTHTHHAKNVCKWNENFMLGQKFFTNKEKHFRIKRESNRK